jgi:hypothetical protein
MPAVTQEPFVEVRLGIVPEGGKFDPKYSTEIV